MSHSCLLAISALLSSLQQVGASDGASTISCEANPSQSHCADVLADDVASDVAIFFQHSLRADILRDASNNTTQISLPEKFQAVATENVSQFAGAPFRPHQHYDTVQTWIAGVLRFSISDPVEEKGLDSWGYWDTFTIAAMLGLLVCFDVFVAPRIPQTMRNHLLVLGFMIALSAFFGVVVFIQRGETDTLAWATGFVVEIALSMDNLFVFYLVFKQFRVVENHRALYALSFGIYGAVFFRVIFVVALSKLLQVSYVVDVIVGALLIISGILTVLDDDDDQDVEELYTVQFFRWVFGDRLQEAGNNSPKRSKADVEERVGDCQLFVTDVSGRTQITLLCLVVCVISVVDVFFAVDSVGSKTGQIKSVFINLSSSLMAMFSLRAMYFIVKDLNDYFAYVKYGICAILCFVGVEMIISRWYSVPLGIMCAIIAALFSASVLASIVKVWAEDADENTCADEDGMTPTKTTLGGA